MALSEQLKKRINDAITDKEDAAELIAQIEVSVATQADNVLDNSPADAVEVSTDDTYSDAAINVALSSVNDDINADRLQINAILDVLKASGLMLADD